MTTQSTPTKSITTKLVSQLKQEDQDFEFYPSSIEMIDCVKHDIRKRFYINADSNIGQSILDVGAGDGRILNSLTKGKKYAIEVSDTLLATLSHDIFVVGTDFNQQTLIDKKVDIIFSNPPYTVYDNWASKIISEANASTIYLIIPVRWQDNQEIQQAIEERKAKVEILGTFDFSDGDRPTRHGADVHVIRISLATIDTYGRTCNAKTEPFSLWFDKHFSIADKLAPQKRASAAKNKPDSTAPSLKNQLIKSEGLVKALETFYNKALKELTDNYTKLGELDSDLMRMMGIEIKKLREALKLKIENLKSLYWKELFENLTVLTTRLTKSSRAVLLDKLFSETHVDFTASNAHAIILWSIKNANAYFDSQLVSAMETMMNKANVVAYKSNKKTFGDETWRYASCEYQDPKMNAGKVSHLKLEYRIVIAGCHGINNSPYEDEAINGLTRTGCDFINDLRTIATNIGFDTTNQQGLESLHWKTGKPNNIMFYDHTSGSQQILFEAKAHFNGNMHIKFNQNFMIKLNTEFGRLRGWLKTAKQAAEEMDIPLKQAELSFNSNLQLECSTTNLLLTLDKAPALSAA